MALQLKDATEWSAAIEAPYNSQIYPIVDPNTGTVMNMNSFKNKYTIKAKKVDMYLLNTKLLPSS